MPASAKNVFLFSVDLEDIRLRMDDGSKYKPRVEAMMEQYFNFLNKYKAKATFFTVGDIPKEYPNLIKTIIAEGHEIACHSNKHIPVTEQTPEEFKTDLLRNIENLSDAGASDIIGYRAPIYSITPKTPWAFDILSEAGIKYSSSVLPAKNPFYGWDNFGERPQKMKNGLWEIPVSIRGGNFLNVPFSGGVYFRALPMPLIKTGFKKYYSKGEAVTSYFHPYDIDTEQESLMHPGINNSRLYNYIMYYNRKSVFPRLEKIMETFRCEIITYKSYMERLNGDNSIYIAEAEQITYYLLSVPVQESEKDKYADAMQKLNIQFSEYEKALWKNMLKSKFRMASIDAGLALKEPNNNVRRKLFTMLAILESSPNYTSYFLSKKQSFFYLFKLTGVGIRAVWRAMIGILIVKNIKRKCS